MKLTFLINGSPESSAAERASHLAQGFPSNWDIRFNYRFRSKWKSILAFLFDMLCHKPELVYVMDTAYSGVLAAFLAKQFLRFRFTLDTGDVAYELARSLGIYSVFQLSLIKWIEKLAIYQSDCIIVRGSHHKKWLEDQGFEPVEFVPDGVQVSEIPLLENEKLKEELGLNDQLTVGLIGTMAWSERHQMCYGWDVVEAIALLKGQPVKGLLIGDGDGRKILEKRVKELGIKDQIIFLGQVPYSDLPKYLAAMDVCISTQSNDLVGMVRTTGKLPLYLAHGKYVIATDVGEAQKVLPGVGCLLPYEGVRDDQHPVRLAHHLSEILENPERLNVATKARQVAKDNFDYPMLAQRVETICRNLLTPSKN